LRRGQQVVARGIVYTSRKHQLSRVRRMPLCRAGPLIAYPQIG